MSLFNKGIAIYYSALVRALLHNSVFCLLRELKSCGDVLDLGCGCDSRLRYWKGDFSVGVEYSYLDLLLSKKKNIHKFYIHADINTVEFKPRSFDAVLLIDVITAVPMFLN